MATLEMKLNPATFLAGGALAVAYTKTTSQAMPPEAILKSVISLKKSRDYGSGGSTGMGARYSSAVLNDSSFTVGAIHLSAENTTFLESEQLVDAGTWYKNSLADLVNKGIVIVTIGGVAQTPAQIIAL